jgi:hypothetical protein
MLDRDRQEAAQRGAAIGGAIPAAAVQGYRGYKNLGKNEDDEDATQGAWGQMLGAGLNVAGAATPGWLGRLAQVAALGSNVYAKDKYADACAKAWINAASESDPDKRYRNLTLLSMMKCS